MLYTSLERYFKEFRLIFLLDFYGKFKVLLLDLSVHALIKWCHSIKA